MRGNFRPEIFGELTSSAGGIIEKFDITVSAIFCCCKDNEYYLNKAKVTRSTITYNLSMKQPSKRALKSIRNLPDELARVSLLAVESLKEQGCR